MHEWPLVSLHLTHSFCSHFQPCFVLCQIPLRVCASLLDEGVDVPWNDYEGRYQVFFAKILGSFSIRAKDVHSFARFASHFPAIWEMDSGYRVSKRKENEPKPSEVPVNWGRCLQGIMIHGHARLIIYAFPYFNCVTIEITCSYQTTIIEPQTVQGIKPCAFTIIIFIHARKSRLHNTH